MTAPEPPTANWDPSSDLCPVWTSPKRGVISRARNGMLFAVAGNWRPIDELPADAVRLVPEHPGVAALLRRCDDIEAAPHERPLTSTLIPIAEVRALLGGGQP